MNKKEIVKFFVVAVEGNTKSYHSPSEYTLLSSLTSACYTSLCWITQRK